MSRRRRRQLGTLKTRKHLIIHTWRSVNYPKSESAQPSGDFTERLWKEKIKNLKTGITTVRFCSEQRNMSSLAVGSQTNWRAAQLYSLLKFPFMNLWKNNWGLFHNFNGSRLYPFPHSLIVNNVRCINEYIKEISFRLEALKESCIVVD